jgi:hypothetical protein
MKPGGSAAPMKERLKTMPEANALLVRRHPRPSVVAFARHASDELWQLIAVHHDGTFDVPSGI